MKSLRVIIILVIFSLFFCSIFRQRKGISYFEFEMNGQTYQILSVNSPQSGPPYNQLAGKDFIVIDIKQDQNIDEVLVGDIEKIDDYLKIYKYGIQLAFEKGKLKEKEDSYSYIYSTRGKYYQITTYFHAIEKPHNEFTYVEIFANSRIVKAIDRNADGILDNITSGFYDMKKLQYEYSEFIKNGVTKNKIAFKDGMYLVIPQE